MIQCRACGSSVTPEFVRVFGSNDGELFGCPACTEYVELFEGRAARQNA